MNQVSRVPRRYTVPAALLVKSVVFVQEWSHRGGAGLIAYGTPATRADVHYLDVTDAWPPRTDAQDEVPSVVYCRWLEGNCMPKSPWLIAKRCLH